MAAAFILIAAGVFLGALFCFGIKKSRSGDTYAEARNLNRFLTLVAGSLGVIVFVTGLAKLIIPMVVIVTRIILPEYASDLLQKIFGWFLHY